MVFNKRPGSKTPPNNTDYTQHQGSNQNPSSRAMTGPIYSPSSQFGSNYNNPRHSSVDRNMDFNMRNNLAMTNNRPHFENPNDMLSQNEIPKDLKGLGFWNDENENKYEDTPNEEVTNSSPIKFAVGVVALVIVSSVLWMSYRWATQTQIQGIPHIQAEEGHYKIKSENPGGIVFPHQEMLVYGRLSPQQQNKRQNENILPPQEQYHFDHQHQHAYENNQPHYQDNNQRYNPSLHTEGEHHVPMQQHQNVQIEQQYANNSPYEYGNAEQQQAHVYREQLPMQQQQNVPFDQGFTTYDDQNPIQENRIPVSQQRKNNIQQDISEEQPIHYSVEKKQNDKILPATKEPQITREVIKSAPAKTEDTVKSILSKQTIPEKISKPAANKTGYFMVIGSLPSSASAKSEWIRIKKKYQQELKDSNASIKQSEVGIKKVYKIFIGPFQEKNIALKRCLKIRNGCKVVHIK